MDKGEEKRGGGELIHVVETHFCPTSYLGKTQHHCKIHLLFDLFYIPFFFNIQCIFFISFRLSLSFKFNTKRQSDKINFV